MDAWTVQTDVTRERRHMDDRCCQMRYGIVQHYQLLFYLMFAGIFFQIQTNIFLILFSNWIALQCQNCTELWNHIAYLRIWAPTNVVVRNVIPFRLFHQCETIFTLHLLLLFNPLQWVFFFVVLWIINRAKLQQPYHVLTAHKIHFCSYQSR